METHIFNSVVRLVIEKGESSVKWSEETKVTSISVRRKVDGDFKNVKLDKHYIHQVVTNFNSLKDEDILPLKCNNSTQINEKSETALNAGDSDYEEVDIDEPCSNEFDDNECILEARCAVLKE